MTRRQKILIAITALVGWIALATWIADINGYRITPLHERYEPTSIRYWLKARRPDVEALVQSPYWQPYKAPVGESFSLSTEFITRLTDDKRSEILHRVVSLAAMEPPRGRTAHHAERLTGFVGMLIDNGGDVMARNEFTHTLLHTAVVYSRGNTQLLRTLLDRGADIEARDEFGFTPLRKAIEQTDEGSNEVIAFLIAHGADVNTKARDHLLFEAIRKGSQQDLIDARAGKHSDRANAIWLDDQEFADRIDILHSAGADFYTRDDNGQNLLHTATFWDQSRSIIPKLIGFGINPNQRDSYQGAPSNLLTEGFGTPRQLAQTLALGLDPNIAQDKTGGTALHNGPDLRAQATLNLTEDQQAAYIRFHFYLRLSNRISFDYQPFEFSKIMLEAGANPFLQDDYGLLPARVLCSSNTAEAVQLCRDHVMPVLALFPPHERAEGQTEYLIQQAAFWASIAQDLLDGAGSTSQDWVGGTVEPEITLSDPVTPDIVRGLLRAGGSPFMVFEGRQTVAERLKLSSYAEARQIYAELIVPMGTLDQSPWAVPRYRTHSPYEEEFWEGAKTDDIAELVAQDIHLIHRLHHDSDSSAGQAVWHADRAAGMLHKVSTLEQLDMLLKAEWGGSSGIWAHLLLSRPVKYVQCRDKPPVGEKLVREQATASKIRYILDKEIQLDPLPQILEYRREPLLIAYSAWPVEGSDRMLEQLLKQPTLNINATLVNTGIKGGNSLLRALTCRSENKAEQANKIRHLIRAGADLHHREWAKGSISRGRTAFEVLTRHKEPELQAVYQEVMDGTLAPASQAK